MRCGYSLHIRVTSRRDINTITRVMNMHISPLAFLVLTFNHLKFDQSLFDYFFFSTHFTSSMCSCVRTHWPILLFSPSHILNMNQNIGYFTVHIFTIHCFSFSFFAFSHSHLHHNRVFGAILFLCRSHFCWGFSFIFLNNSSQV